MSTYKIMLKLKKLVESDFFEKFIIVVISINAITLGLETVPNLSAQASSTLYFLDKLFLSIFVVELCLKLFVYRLSFYKDPWRIFDFIIVSIALVPASGPFTVLRSLRILRALRMLSVVPSLRKVINSLLMAVPSLGGVALIILLVFYISAVMATKLFANSFPDWFGNIGYSAYSLFQIMTLESWSMGIVRPVMEVYPMAWLFFLPFILITTFTMLNLFIAVIVNAMQAETDAMAEQRAEKGHEERLLLMQEIKEIKSELKKLTAK